MKISHGNPAYLTVAATLALLLTAGCASAPQTAHNGSSNPRTVTDTWATETPRANVNVRQDAYANNTPEGQRRRVITGSLIPQDVDVNGNSANSATPTRVYGQGDLQRHGGGISTGDSLSRIDPAISVSGR